jgi:Arc/MetJ family transcription regulator
MTSRKTSVEIDEQLLRRAREILGSTTVKETIDRAFREIVRQEARRQEAKALAAMDSIDLADDQVMAGAWRP